MPYWEEADNSETPATEVETEIEAPDNTPQSLTVDDVDALVEEVRGIRTDIANLNDLFVRRLLEDRQKSQLISTLQDIASFTLIEPFVHDLILLLDRIERVDDDFAKSVAEELLDVLERRDVKKVSVTRDFDPNLQRVVKVVDSTDIEKKEVIGIVRNGYVLGNKVIRPAEVVLGNPVSVAEEEIEGEE